MGLPQIGHCNRKKTLVIPSLASGIWNGIRFESHCAYAVNFTSAYLEVASPLLMENRGRWLTYTHHHLILLAKISSPASELLPFISSPQQLCTHCIPPIVCLTICCCLLSKILSHAKIFRSRYTVTGTEMLFSFEFDNVIREMWAHHSLATFHSM